MFVIRSVNILIILIKFTLVPANPGLEAACKLCRDAEGSPPACLCRLVLHFHETRKSL